MAEESIGGAPPRQGSTPCRATNGAYCTTTVAGQATCGDHHSGRRAGGVLVVDAKSWAGIVNVREGVLRQDRYSRQGAVTQCADAGHAIAQQLRNVAARSSRCCAWSAARGSRWSVTECSCAARPTSPNCCSPARGCWPTYRCSASLTTSLGARCPGRCHTA